MDIWRSLKLVKDKFLIFLLASIVSFVAILVFPSLAARRLDLYRSSAKILITPGAQDVRVAGERQDRGSTWFGDEATLRTLLASQELMEEVIKTCGLKLEWTELRTKIQLEVLSEGGQQVSLLEISAIGSRPEEARLITQTTCDKFVAYVQQLSTAEHDKTVMFLERERRNAEREVVRTQKRMLKAGFVPGAKGGTASDDEWLMLQKAKQEQEAAITQVQIDIEEIGLSNDSGPGAEEHVGSLYDTNLSKEEIKLEELREVYTNRSPQVQKQLEVVERLRKLRNVKVNNIQSARMAAAQKKLSKFQDLLNKTNSKVKVLEAVRPTAEKFMQYTIDERQLAMWQENLLDLTRQLYRARVMQQSSRRDGAFTVVEKPQPGLLAAGTKVAKSPLVRALMAIPAAAFCGFGFLMLLDYLTSTMKMQPRIQDALGLPIIGSIPVLPTDMVSSWDSMKGQVRKSKSA